MQSACNVPRVMSAARWPRVSFSLVAISSAALLVKVTAQSWLGAKPCFVMRCSTRAMRQKVLPAPGPAITRVGPNGASIAIRWAGSGVTDMGETQEEINSATERCPPWQTPSAASRNAVAAG